MKNIKISKYQSKEFLCQAVADRCAEQLVTELETEDSASFIIPGGTTPAPAFEILSKKDLDWQRVTIAQSDERWVDAEHTQSNQGLTRRTLLINNAAAANYVPMKNDFATALDGEADCNAAYESMPSPFNLTLLGMGADGHFASLFPGARNLSEAMTLDNHNICIAVDAQGCPVAGDFPNRMSLTLASILKSKLILLMITGDKKLEVLDNAGNSGNEFEYPIAALINQSDTPVEIFWCP